MDFHAIAVTAVTQQLLQIFSFCEGVSVDVSPFYSAQKVQFAQASAADRCNFAICRQNSPPKRILSPATFVGIPDTSLLQYI